MNNNEMLNNLIKKAKSLGADGVDVILSESETLSASTRLTKLEKVVQADVMNVDMRVFIGRRSVSISTDNINELKGDVFIEKAIFAAKNSAEEFSKSRADASELCKNFKKIDTYDDFEVNHEMLIKSAQTCENIALQSAGITNSEGAEAGFSRTQFTLMRDDGFCGSYKRSRNMLSVVTLAEKNGNMERGCDFSEATYYSDLKTPEQIAREAVEKTLKKLGARKVQSCKVPVVFHKNVSPQLLRSMLDALNGSAVAKGISFLKNKLSEKIFSDKINIVDRYALDRGLRSRPFDSDGLECSDNNIVSAGVLNSFLLNTKYANKLGMKSTGNAYGWESISPNNVSIENGVESYEDLMKNIKCGLLVTEVLGNGLNIVTGNYSQGAVGFWIENGEISYPVNEITIAGNFIDMFANCTVAGDLKVEQGIDSPTLFMEEMIVGGF